MFNKISKIVLAILCFVFLSACSGGGGSKPKETIENYLRALNSGDIDSAVEYVIEDRRQEHKDILINFNKGQLDEYAEALNNAVFSEECYDRNPENGDSCVYTLKRNIAGQDIVIDQSMLYINGNWFLVD